MPHIVVITLENECTKKKENTTDIYIYTYVHVGRMFLFLASKFHRGYVYLGGYYLGDLFNGPIPSVHSELLAYMFM